MKQRGVRVVLSLGLLLSLPAALLAQVKPVLMSALTAVPGSPAAAVRSPGLAVAPILAAPGLSPAAALAPALAAPSAVAAPRAAVAGARATNQIVIGVDRMGHGLVAADYVLSAADPSGRAAFDGGREHNEIVIGPDGLGHGLVAGTYLPSDAPARAERGDTIAFNGKALPARMFSDQTLISSHLIDAIDAAKKTIDIAIYELGIKEVLDALRRAKAADRGVRIRIVVDQGHVYPERPDGRVTPEITALITEGFEVKTLRGADAFGIMHNKFAVFDGALMETGSYNWSRAADNMNFENALFDDNGARIASYQRYWDWMWSIGRAADLSHPPEKVVLDGNGKSAPLPPAPQDTEFPLSFGGKAFPLQAFTPHGAAKFVVSAIDASTERVDLANFSFTNTEIIEALKRAKTRLGADKVRLIFDRRQYQALPAMAQMTDLGFQVRLSAGREGKGVMHHKFGVFDGKFVETGSFNWTNGGEFTNFENALFTDARADIDGFAGTFERIWGQSSPPTAAPVRFSPVSFNGTELPAQSHSPAAAAAWVAAAVGAAKQGVDLVNAPVTMETVAALKAAKDRLGAGKIRLVFDKRREDSARAAAKFGLLGLDVRFVDGAEATRYGVFDGRLVHAEGASAGPHSFRDEAAVAADHAGRFQRLWDASAAAPTLAPAPAPPAAH